MAQQKTGKALSGALSRMPKGQAPRGGYVDTIASKYPSTAANIAAGYTRGPISPAMIYAGGTPYFNERTGQYTGPKPGEGFVSIPENRWPQPVPQISPPVTTPIPNLQRLSPGVYRSPTGELVDSQNRPIGRPAVSRPQMPGFGQGISPVPMYANPYQNVPSGFSHRPTPVAKVPNYNIQPLAEQAVAGAEQGMQQPYQQYWK